MCHPQEMPNSGLAHQENSGLDIGLGDRCSKIAFSWAKKTFSNRKEGAGAPCMGVDGMFANVVRLDGLTLGIGSDGIGTKIELAERMGIYDTIGFDLLAMVADDLLANGLEPVGISNILDVDSLDPQVVDSLMRGLHDAANVAGVVITGGEIAELGRRIQGYGDGMHFNWCATALGVLGTGRGIIDGRSINPGDHVISLRSRGFRSNGFSLIRKILNNAFGPEWHTVPYREGELWGEELLTSSLVYTPVVVGLFKRGFDIRGIAHITGGGIMGNLSRVLSPRGLGATLDSPFRALDIMKRVQSLGDVAEEQAYSLWNMGNGLLLVVDRGDSRQIVEFCEERGYQSKVAGIIVSESEIKLQTSGCNSCVLTLTVA